MAIKRYKADADNTIVNAFQPNNSTRGTGSNSGQADVVEVYSVFGRQQASSSAATGSQELSRILMKFPISDISTDRTASKIPASGSVKFYLRLFDAKTSKTVPKNYKLVVQAVSRSWEEGAGMDLERYSDLTKNGSGSNWIRASKTEAWSNVGGDYHTSPTFTQYFTGGLGDLSVNITELVEEWIDSSKSNYGVGIRLTASNEAYSSASSDSYASASINFTEGAAIGAVSGAAYTVIDYLGTSKTYIAISSATTGDTGKLDSAGKVAFVVGNGAFSSYQAIQQLSAAINSSNGHNTGNAGSRIGINLSTTGSTSIIYLTQAVAGEAGNTTLTSATASTTTGITASNGFEGGSQLNTVYNIDGATTSYYTKRFFARGSQYFFKRPVIEARWDSTVKDDRGAFYFSSSLASKSDNLNTLYLYNYVRGKLKNIPAIGKDNIFVSLYSGSSDDSAPSGSKLVLYDSSTSATGGWHKTGIYTCSIALTKSTSATLETLYDVWHNNSGSEYFTGSIKPYVLRGSTNAREPTYYLSITNLQNSYMRDQNARFNVFVREKNWNPTIYTKAVASAPSQVIYSASYRVVRTIDGLEAIPYNTGSDSATGMSYDVSGNYVDVDMELLDPGYEYSLKFAFYDPELSSWQEHNEQFKFRVEDYEY
jgi:hypothetical protein